MIFSVVLASLAVYGWKLLGYLVPERFITDKFKVFTERVTLVLLSGLVAIQTLVSANGVEFDARIPAVGIAAILFALRVPYIIVVIAAAAVAAGLRILGF